LLKIFALLNQIASEFLFLLI